MQSTYIVFADANSAVASAAARKLMASGHKVDQVADASGALERLSSTGSELIVVDFDLPDILGLDLLREIKSNPQYCEVRVLMTSRKGDIDAVAALESGADDYLSKPYSLNELQARIATALRRPPLRYDQFSEDNTAGPIRIDTVRHQVEVNRDPIALSPLEYNLLQFLINNQDRMYTRQELLNHVWKDASNVSERTVDVNIRRLRSRLAPYQCEDYIQTVRGSGYRFSAMHSGTSRVTVLR